MSDEKVSEKTTAWRAGTRRVAGSMPWLKPKQIQYFRAKVFKSGNSLALRLPAGLGLAAGQEMEMQAEDGLYFSFEPVNAPKRKFAIDKVWGSATGLELISCDDRLFDERPLFDENGQGA